MQCSWKTFMVHQTIVQWALYILLKFVKSLIGHSALAIGNVWHVRRFSWTLRNEFSISIGDDGMLFTWDNISPSMNWLMERHNSWKRSAVFNCHSNIQTTGNGLSLILCQAAKPLPEPMVTIWTAPSTHSGISNSLRHICGQVRHICVTKLIIIGSNNGLSPGRRQAIIWTNDGILLIWSLGTNFSEMLIGIHIFSFKKMHFKMSSWYGRPFCLGLNVLTQYVLKSFNESPTAHMLARHFFRFPWGSLPQSTALSTAACKCLYK